MNNLKEVKVMIDTSGKFHSVYQCWDKFRYPNSESDWLIALSKLQSLSGFKGYNLLGSPYFWLNSSECPHLVFDKNNRDNKLYLYPTCFSGKATKEQIDWLVETINTMKDTDRYDCGEDRDTSYRKVMFVKSVIWC